jgi:hypothetical protein
VYAQWPADAFELSGEISSYDDRGFCPRCGCRLLDTAEHGDALVEIRLGSLDEAPFELKPEVEIWVKRRELDTAGRGRSAVRRRRTSARGIRLLDGIKHMLTTVNRRGHTFGRRRPND